MMSAPGHSTAAKIPKVIPRARHMVFRGPGARARGMFGPRRLDWWSYVSACSRNVGPSIRPMGLTFPHGQLLLPSQRAAVDGGRDSDTEEPVDRYGRARGFPHDVDGPPSDSSEGQPPLPPLPAWPARPVESPLRTPTPRSRRTQPRSDRSLLRLTREVGLLTPTPLQHER